MIAAPTIPPSWTSSDLKTNLSRTVRFLKFPSLSLYEWSNISIINFHAYIRSSLILGLETHSQPLAVYLHHYRRYIKDRTQELKNRHRLCTWEWVSLIYQDIQFNWSCPWSGSRANISPESTIARYGFKITLGNKTPSQPECRSQTLSNQVSSCHFDLLRLSYFRGKFSPCREENSMVQRLELFTEISRMIYHLISQNGKHGPGTAQPSPDWPPLSGLVSIIRQFPRKKGTLAVRQGERVSTNMM